MRFLQLNVGLTTLGYFFSFSFLFLSFPFFPFFPFFPSPSSLPSPLLSSFLTPPPLLHTALSWNQKLWHLLLFVFGGEVGCGGEVCPPWIGAQRASGVFWQQIVPYPWMAPGTQFMSLPGLMEGYANQTRFIASLNSSVVIASNWGLFINVIDVKKKLQTWRSPPQRAMIAS